MTVKEIIKLIIDSDFDKAFDALDDVFGNDFEVYNDFNNTYVSPPQNFNIVRFRSRLIRFIKIQKDFINGIELDKKQAQINESDEIYNLLCHLNFIHQVDYFKALTTGSNKPVIPFVLRAKKNHGQKWLYNRLIFHYQEEKNIHPPIVLNFKELKFDFESFVNELSLKAIDANKYDPIQDIKKRKIKLKDAIKEKVKTATQFIIFKESYAFIHSPEFQEFYKWLDYMNEEIDALDSGHKCIFLFVENDSKPYEKREHCIFSSEIRARNAKTETNLKLIDLDEILPLGVNCIEKWLDKIPQDYYVFGNDIEQLLQDANCGNPEILIPLICEKINIDYKEFENKWLKH